MNETDLITRRIPWSGGAGQDNALLLSREWLLTNGLGGYASGTIAGACTRRYHGLLVAALPAPRGRTVMFNHLAEEVLTASGLVSLVGEEAPGAAPNLPVATVLREFDLELGLPVWRFETAEFALEKRIVLAHLQNTVYVGYRVTRAKTPVRIRLRPSLHFRPHDGPVNFSPALDYATHVDGDRVEVSGPDMPALRMLVHGAAATFVSNDQTREFYYRVETSRGYDSQGTVWSPGHFEIALAEAEQITLIASTEDWDRAMASSADEAFAAESERRLQLLARAHPAVQRGVPAELVLAADQFLIRPATADDERTVIAGYHWFTDWGRDTMISLEGLTLTTGRFTEAAKILRRFANHVRDGLIPNLFPEGHTEGVYHTADATLWFFHAVDRYVHATGDRATLEELLPVLKDIVRQHLQGTRFGIGVDPSDGLLKQGQDGYQLTWMDAKVDGWVVTPRRGKAVEINALWYNALRVLEGWLRERGDAAADNVGEHAARVYRAFNERFWYPAGQYLYDVVDGEQGDDASFRPNQIFAVSLPHAVLDPRHWRPVVNAVRDRLLTPHGLRSLAPGERDYQPIYDGDLRTRDAAYHQGTVWGWLIGPFIDAWLRAYPDDRQQARSYLAAFDDHLSEAGIGSISEVFDAEAPYTPRGCIAQAWSVAEVLRCWAKIEG